LDSGTSAPYLVAGYFHMYAKAGINYKLGRSLVESRHIWMNGPFKAGSNYVSTFMKKELKAKLQAIHKGGIGGYSGHPLQLSTPKANGSGGIKKCKSCALKCHEKCNGYTRLLTVSVVASTTVSINFKIALRGYVSFVNIKWRMGTNV
jgi:hypothetical protein